MHLAVCVFVCVCDQKHVCTLSGHISLQKIMHTTHLSTYMSPEMYWSYKSAIPHVSVHVIIHTGFPEALSKHYGKKTGEVGFKIILIVFLCTCIESTEKLNDEPPTMNSIGAVQRSPLTGHA